MNLLNYLEAYGTTEGALAGWDERGRNALDVAKTSQGYSPAVHQGDRIEFRHGNGHSLTVHDDGHWFWKGADARDDHTAKGKGASSLYDFMQYRKKYD